MSNQSSAREIYINSRARFLLTNAIFLLVVNALIFFSMSLNIDASLLLLRSKDIVEILSVAHDLQAKTFDTSIIKSSIGESQTRKIKTIIAMPAYIDLQNRFKAHAADSSWGESFFKGEQWLLKDYDPGSSEDAKNWIYVTSTKMSADLVVTSLGLKKKSEAVFFCYILIGILIGVWVTMIYHRIKLKRSMQSAPYIVPSSVKEALKGAGL